MSEAVEAKANPKREQAEDAVVASFVALWEDLESIPTVPDAIQPNEVLTLVEGCARFGVDFSPYAQAAGDEPTAVFQIVTMGSGGRTEIASRTCRARRHDDLLQHPEGAWLPDFHLLGARQLLGRLKQEAQHRLEAYQQPPTRN